MKTLQQLSAEALAREADQPAVNFEGAWYSWGQLREVADQIHALLEQSGAGADTTVTFIPRNRPSALSALMTFLSHGRNVRMLYPFQSAASLARQIEQQQTNAQQPAYDRPAAVIAAARDFSEEVIAVLREQGIVGIALSEMKAELVAGCERIGAQRQPVVAPDESVERRIEILTSGTTGTPKPFPIPYSLIENHMIGEQLRTGQMPYFSGEAPALLYFPMGNITGIHTTVPPLIKGQSIMLLDKFDLQAWCQYVKEYRPETSGIPPAAMGQLLDANVAAEDLSSLKSMGSGAAPLDPSLHREFERRYQIPILLSYGATEFGGPVTGWSVALHQQFSEAKFGSVGKAFPGGFNVRVVDAITEQELPAGEEGILEVVSPRIGSHWIRTSDIAMIDSDGFVFLRGRADGAIMRGGFKVLPETIEKALLLHPAVSSVSVVGVPDKRVTEVPAAAIELRAGVSAPTPEELAAHLREHLLATHIPVHWQFVDGLPKTPSFKIDRPAVKRLFSEEGTAQ
jgi:long-chain acyl-CoA synthetase